MISRIKQVAQFAEVEAESESEALELAKDDFDTNWVDDCPNDEYEDYQVIDIVED